jgi:hypothetical protein
MLPAIRKAVALPVPLPLEGFATLATLLGFFWLLVQGHIQPIAIYLLELYLTF